MIKHRVGEGLLNTIINKLPFEAHLPAFPSKGTYNYCGPGTKLEARLARGDQGINPLDSACKEHDIAYANQGDLEDRHRADKILEEKAWARVKAKDSKFGEKAAAWFVTTAMKAKRKLGMGVRDGGGGGAKGRGGKLRKRKRKHSSAKRKGITKKMKNLGSVIRISRGAIKKIKSPSSVHDVIATAISAARKAISDAGGKNHIRRPRVIPLPIHTADSKIGGFLPLLPAVFGALSALGALTGGTAGVIKTINEAKDAKQKLNEMQHHNRKMEAIALSKGKGLYLSKRPAPATGMGLYLGKKPKN